MKDISKLFERASKKRDLSDQSKTCEDPKNMREERSAGNLTDMADDVFAECLKSPECIEILFICFRNVERQTKDIYTSAHSTQDHQNKGEKQLIDLTESINFLSDKFKEYEEDRAKKDKITEDLKSEVDGLSTKIEKLEKLQDQQEQYSRRNCLLVHGIAAEKEEIKDEVIINTLNEKLDLDITLREIERTNWIGEPKKTRPKTRPIIVKFVQCKDRNRVFRNNKKLKGQKISVTESLAKIRIDKLRQAKEIYEFTNVWTKDRKILSKSDGNAKPQVYYS